MQNDYFEWPAYTGPSSRIIKKPKEWYDKGILVPHEVFRWWDKNILEILEVFDPISQPDTEWKIDAFFNWLENYYVIGIHHHHETEEHIYNPAIEEKIGRPLEAGIKTDHETLLAMLEDLPTYRDPIAGGDKAQLAEFKVKMKKFVTTMEDHLAMEEKFYPAVLKEAFTQEEEAAVVQEIIGSLGLDGNKKMLPPVAYAMCMWDGEDGVMEFVATLPPPIRLLYNNSWIPDFYKNQLSVLDALHGSEEPINDQCGCSLM